MSDAFQRKYEKGFEAQWKSGGCHWGKHLPKNGDPEWMRVIFQDMPADAGLGGLELEVRDTQPTIWVLACEVVQPLWQYRAENRRTDEFGSCISVCVQTYTVESAIRHHRGGIKVMLKHRGCCSEYDPTFDDELEDLLCDEDVCIDVSEPEKPDPPVRVRCAPRCVCPVCAGLQPLPAHNRPKMPWRLPERISRR